MGYEGSLAPHPYPAPGGTPFPGFGGSPYGGGRTPTGAEPMGLVLVPSVLGRSVDEARALLEAAGLTVELDSERGSGRPFGDGGGRGGGGGGGGGRGFAEVSAQDLPAANARLAWICGWSPPVAAKPPQSPAMLRACG